MVWCGWSKYPSVAAIAKYCHTHRDQDFRGITHRFLESQNPIKLLRLFLSKFLEFDEIQMTYKWISCSHQPSYILSLLRVNCNVSREACDISSSPLEASNPPTITKVRLKTRQSHINTHMGPIKLGRDVTIP
jgi:hypothetical protein